MAVAVGRARRVLDDRPRGHDRSEPLTRSAAGAPVGTAGLAGGTGSRRRYGADCAGRGSGSPRLGHSDTARSACAVMVNDGFTPRLAVTAAPSSTCSVG